MFPSRRFTDDYNVNKWLGFMFPWATGRIYCSRLAARSAVGRQWIVFAGYNFFQGSLGYFCSRSRVRGVAGGGCGEAVTMQLSYEVLYCFIFRIHLVIQSALLC